MTHPLAELGRMLELQRPLVIYDLETTGTNRELDRIVQIGAIKIEPDGTVIEKNQLVRPPIPIPPESTAIHHITDETVADAPTFLQLSKGLSKFLHMVDFCGYNVHFDLSVTEAEFKRACVPVTLEGRIIDGSTIMRHYHRRTLTAAVYEYLGREAGEEFEKLAHDAYVDAAWSARVVIAQLKRHGELPHSIEELHVKFFETPEPGYIDPQKKFAWRYGQPVVNFGNKYPLEPFHKVDSGYWRWIIANDFSPLVKRIAKDALEGVFPKKP